MDPSSNPNSSSSETPTSPPRDEPGLLTRAQRGDREAFVALMAPYRERVYATALRLLGNAEDAAEVTQEALLRTFWKLTGFHGRAHFYTWLYRVALNLCYRRLEARRREQLAAADRDLDAAEPSLEERVVDPGAGPREEVASREAVGLVRQALAHLKPSDFHLLVLREFDGLRYEELAARLHLPKGTVMSRLHRARLALAEQLTRLGLQSQSL